MKSWFSYKLLLKCLDDKFYKVDSKAFCRNCYQNFASICFCCQKFIIEKAVSLFGKIYHRSCLKCAKCENNDFQDDFYFEHQDEIYHENCYKESLYEKCCLCKNHCDAEFIRIENKVISLLFFIYIYLIKFSNKYIKKLLCLFNFMFLFTYFYFIEIFSLFINNVLTFIETTRKKW